MRVDYRRSMPVGPDQVRVRTLLSGISAGTELTQYRGTSPLLTMRWDPVRRLFEDDSGVAPYPLETWGYEEVGAVVEVGRAVSEPAVGDVVWGSWGHRGEAVLEAGEAAPRRLEPGQTPLAGAFARMGAIALNAVFDAEVLLGEWVAVFGQGVVGLLVTQLATQSGARVIAVDLSQHRLALARRLGAEHVLAASEEDVAVRIKDLTGGRGADVAIEVSGAHAALAQAIRAIAYGSRVVAAGAYQGGAEALFLGREFHHNRVELRCSQTQGIRAGIQHRWDRLRIEQTVVALAAAGRLQLEPLVSHRLPVERAPEAYAMLDAGSEAAIQVLLEFSAEPSA
ncbi:MAG: zinc-binding dehydrogenase [Candidatus Dormibacteraeota bacterium]|nr:zinc-binding dehydrogenase [Candidatus Dormibacteraeota bacterium]